MPKRKPDLFDVASPEKKKFEPPSIEDVKDYFLEKKRPDLAEEFWEHFENCDWRLSSGRGAKMKNWMLAANKWIRDAWKFEPRHSQPVQAADVPRTFARFREE